MRWITEKHLKRWQDKGLLGADKAQELRAEMTDLYGNRGIQIFGAIGAVLVGLGVILFVASNWEEMGQTRRLAVLLAGFAAAAAGAWFAGRRGLPKVAEALWLTTTLVFGANIFLIAQIYHRELIYWQGTLRWMLGALVLGWALRSRLQAAVAVPLFLLTMGWLGASESWLIGHQFETLFSSAGLRPIFPLLGVGLIAVSLLVAQSSSWEFASGSCFGWGLGLLVMTAVVSTTDPRMAGRFFEFDGTNTQIVILIGVGAALTAALLRGRFQWQASRLLLIAITALSAAMLFHLDGEPWVTATIGGVRFAFAGYIVMVFSLTLWTIWTGVRASNVILINIGMATSALLIIFQYFSWSFELLDRSLAFILGGLVLLTLAILMEKKRRALVAGLRPSGGGAS